MSAHDGADGVAAAGNGAVCGEPRRERLLALLADGATDGRRSGASGASGGRMAGPHGLRGLRSRLDRVCAVSVSEVGVDGAGVTVIAGLEDGLAGARDLPAATGPRARRLEELQLTAGEGPCLDAYREGLPVLVGDLTADPARWPGFGPEALEAGAAALFSLPLQVGAVRLGTLDLYRAAPGPLSRRQLADALELASLATEVLLELADDVGAHDDPGAVLAAGWLPHVHADVHVAAGMHSVWAGIDVATALLRLRAHAFARGESLHQVARRVIDRDLIIDDPGTQDTNHGHEPLGPEAENDDP